MAQFIRTSQIAVAVGDAIPFNETVVKGCCNIKHRSGSGLVIVHGGSCCNPALYRVSFHGNVTGVQGLIQLGIYLDGELLPETRMSVVTGGTSTVTSLDSDTFIPINCECGTISVRVIAGDTVSLTTASIIVTKEG